MNPCTYCGKVYRNIDARKKHLRFCHELHKIQTESIQTNDFCSSRSRIYEDEDEENLPSMKDMYSMLQHILKLYDKQSKELECLKKSIQGKRNLKTNLRTWIEDKYSNTKFNTFLDEISSLQVSQDDLYLIFELPKLNDSILSILKKYYDTIPRQERAIHCFHHEKTLFILDKNDASEKYWREITLKDKKDAIRIVHNAILIAFREWRNIHKKRIDTELHFHDKVFLPKMNWLMNSPLYEIKIIEGLYKYIVED